MATGNDRYGSLRGEDDGNQAGENVPATEPTRPSRHYGARPGWSDQADMVSQQQSAHALIRATQEQKKADAQAENKPTASASLNDLKIEHAASVEPEQSSGKADGLKAEPAKTYDSISEWEADQPVAENSRERER